MDQPKTTIHLGDFDAHFCVWIFFHAFVFSVGKDVLGQVCENSFEGESEETLHKMAFFLHSGHI